MRNTTRQVTDHFELLRLSQSILQRETFRDITRIQHQSTNSWLE